MKPTLGRVVIAQTDANYNNGSDLAPAVITRVWGERPEGGWTVNVKVLRDALSEEWKTSVVLFDIEEQAREYGLGGCFWPSRS
jgi:subtilisin-like proprotein convertase family protein